jgi:hypothetical protein
VQYWTAVILEQRADLSVCLFVSALKVKLMLRRPINQLVAQGIMPREYPSSCEEVSSTGVLTSP